MQITINANGLAQIRAALAEHHRLGGDHFTDAMLLAWVDDVEASWADGNDAAFEISASDSVSGRPVTVVLTADGYDEATGE